MTSTILLIILLLTLMCCTLPLELRRDLMMLQQNSYRPERYRRWIGQSGDSSSPRRLCGMAATLFAMVTFVHPLGGAAMMLLFCAPVSWRLMRAKYKKPLVWTPRARRIYITECVLCLIVIGAVSAPWFRGIERLYAATVTWMALYCGSHIVTLAALWLLKPVDAAINRKYRRRAEKALGDMPGLKIIGITGSYGKTSTKHYLQRILSERYETLMTPGSYNTTLGVIRTVNELLKPYHEVFIVEMGAKNVGDIKEICDLVHPQAGIITAVGEQHLESFGSIEAVQRTKFELADALPPQGPAVINNDFEHAASRAVANTQAIRYAVSHPKGADWHAEDVHTDSTGTTFAAVGPEGVRLELRTRLVGECNVSNILAAVIIAKAMGLTDAEIQRGVAAIEPVEHRMSIRRTPGGVTVIDDAFNSNPAGSAMALDVLASMTGGRRIVVTPGMIELGARQEEANREFGRKMAGCADLVLVVGRYNRDAITEGLAEGGMTPEAVRKPDTFAEAQAMLAGMMRPGDTVLYENDLPDTFK